MTPGSFDIRVERDGSTDRCEWFSEHEARTLPLAPIARLAVELAWPTQEAKTDPGGPCDL